MTKAPAMHPLPTSHLSYPILSWVRFIVLLQQHLRSSTLTNMWDPWDLKQCCSALLVVLKRHKYEQEWHNEARGDALRFNTIISITDDAEHDFSLSSSSTTANSSIGNTIINYKTKEFYRAFRLNWPKSPTTRWVISSRRHRRRNKLDPLEMLFGQLITPQY